MQLRNSGRGSHDFVCLLSLVYVKTQPWQKRRLQLLWDFNMFSAQLCSREMNYFSSPLILCAMFEFDANQILW